MGMFEDIVLATKKEILMAHREQKKMKNDPLKWNLEDISAVKEDVMKELKGYGVTVIEKEGAMPITPTPPEMADGSELPGDFSRELARIRNVQDNARKLTRKQRRALAKACGEKWQDSPLNHRRAE